MTCEWREKTGLYVDGELEPVAQNAFTAHLEGCPACSTAVLEQEELKKAVRIAGKRFSAPPELYAQVRKQITPQEKPGRKFFWQWAMMTALLVVMAALAGSWFARSREDNSTVAQLMGQHVEMLANPARPLDVISTDMHTVKPWYQGKLPFTFNPVKPAQDSPFTLVGGNLVYSGQAPGAELVYQVRQHKISVFIFSAKDVHGDPAAGAQPFTMAGWQQGGLQYYIVTDAAKEDAQQLKALLEEANR